MLHFQKEGNSAYPNVSAVYSHVFDPNERRRLALAEIDKAPFGWYHLRLIVVTGVGFFTDAYSLFAINLTTTMLGMVYWQESNGGSIPHDADTAIKVATSIGTVVGQIFFGYLADLLGRKKMYGIELLIIISATLSQALCAPSQAISFVGVIVFWRVLMGIGVGGDYPLSAVITSEFASTKWRGAIVGAVFAMQGLGQFVAALLALIVTSAYKDTLTAVPDVSECGEQCQNAVDIMWRIVIGFGGIPGWFALYYRLTISETPRYTFDVLQDPEKAIADARRYRSGRSGPAHPDRVKRIQAQQQTKRKYKTKRPTVREFCRYFGNWRHLRTLLGHAGSWFFLDVAFYGLGLNSSSVLAIIGFSNKDNVYQMLYNVAVGQLVLVCAGAIPGYWFTVATVDIVGRKAIQIGGFVILTILFAVIGFCFHNLSQGALLALYILSQFFFNFGPNATTFIAPSETYPTHLRATAHGICAAAGKTGAIIAQVVFAPMVKWGSAAASSTSQTGSVSPSDDSATPWLDKVMQIFALFMFCGIWTSLLIPETKRRSLEDITTEAGDEGVFELRYVNPFYNFGGRSRGNADARRRGARRRSLLGMAAEYLRLSS